MKKVLISEKRIRREKMGIGEREIIDNFNYATIDNGVVEITNPIFKTNTVNVYDERKRITLSSNGKYATTFLYGKNEKLETEILYTSETGKCIINKYEYDKENNIKRKSISYNDMNDVIHEYKYNSFYITESTYFVTKKEEDASKIVFQKILSSFCKTGRTGLPIETETIKFDITEKELYLKLAEEDDNVLMQRIKYNEKDNMKDKETNFINFTRDGKVLSIFNSISELNEPKNYIEKNEYDKYGNQISHINYKLGYKILREFKYDENDKLVFEKDYFVSL